MVVAEERGHKKTLGINFWGLRISKSAKLRLLQLCRLEMTLTVYKTHFNQKGCQENMFRDNLYLTQSSRIHLCAALELLGGGQSGGQVCRVQDCDTRSGRSLFLGSAFRKTHKIRFSECFTDMFCIHIFVTCDQFT